MRSAGHMLMEIQGCRDAMNNLSRLDREAGVRHHQATRNLLLIALVAIPTLAFAQAGGPALPVVDVDRACVSADGPTARLYCVEGEQGAYDRLKRVWSAASATAREKALQNSASALKSRAYYQVLAQLLDTALRVEEMQRPAPPVTRFQR